MVDDLHAAEFMIASTFVQRVSGHARLPSALSGDISPRARRRAGRPTAAVAPRRHTRMPCVPTR